MEPDLAALIEPHTGPIQEAARTPRGYTSDYTGTVCAASGRVFVKAVRDPGRLVSSLGREAAVNPAVRHISPALHWQARGRGWYALGFQHAPGTHASFAPGSPDLPAVTRAIERIAATTPPPAARDWRENRYDRYASGTAGLFAGPTLLHGDINPDNLLIGPDGNVTVVDWSWPTHGAAFIDPACLVVQLIAAGHPPPHAQNWAARCTAWRDADPGSHRRIRRRHPPHAPAVRTTRPRTLAQSDNRRRHQLGRAPTTGTSTTGHAARASRVNGTRAQKQSHKPKPSQRPKAKGQVKDLRLSGVGSPHPHQQHTPQPPRTARHHSTAPSAPQTPGSGQHPAPRHSQAPHGKTPSQAGKVSQQSQAAVRNPRPANRILRPKQCHPDLPGRIVEYGGAHLPRAHLTEIRRAQ